MDRFIVIVLDGFGIGYMEDTKVVRPQDVGSNTLKHILGKMPELKFKNLERLGLMNALGEESLNMKFSNSATFGKSELMHYGADTFFGHQEIMGTKPMKPLREPFSKSIDEVYELLKSKDYDVEYINGKEASLLMVNGAVTVADNIETDLGQAINVTASLDLISFEEVLKIGKLVRSKVRVPRVITFGGKEVTKENILEAIEEKGNGFIGVNAPKSGVYNKGYQCIHLGYGIDQKVQVPTILGEEGIKVTLIGKVADIVSNQYGKSIPWVDTAEVLQLTLDEMKKMDTGFICTNVQETDLSGHAENVERYAEKLSIADKYIGEIIDNLKEEDILVIMADHGNDPTIGHSRHTRECVPLLIHGKNIKNVNIGIRRTLSDIGATVAEYFNVKTPENGESFLSLIK
ncbi:phosphopentomutase [Clostridium amazonitimonense]|uniref:phosphopentomutase n=1 Tax=Clostridium amazonitimonense TaxID=1499689 RepID=UPI0005095D74|nr:phosphopentomutase [Clostridium amazonitimonense]